MKLMGPSIFEGPSSRNTRPFPPPSVDLQDEEEQQQLQAKLQQMEGAVSERGAQASMHSCMHTLTAALTKPSQHSPSTLAALSQRLTATKYALFCAHGGSVLWQHQAQLGLSCALPLTIMLVPELVSSRLGCGTGCDPPRVLA